jgi:hypothetical protein
VWQRTEARCADLPGLFRRGPGGGGRGPRPCGASASTGRSRKHGPRVVRRLV